LGLVLEWEGGLGKVAAEELALGWVAREPGPQGARGVAPEAVLAAGREQVGDLGPAWGPVRVRGAEAE